MQFVEFYCSSNTIQAILRHLSAQIVINATSFYKAKIKEAAIQHYGKCNPQAAGHSQLYAASLF